MLTLHEAARGMGAESAGENITFTGVTADSRAVQPGDLFVALRGERFDGHQFIAQAIASGAVAVMAVRDAAPEKIPALIVDDTRLGLGALAAFWRNRFTAPLVAITGSNGKTTVKEMLAAILRAATGEDAVLATQGNLNNEIGMPLTLLKLRQCHRYAVLEMGMNHPGEIAYLSGLAKPDVALINNAQAAHLEGLQDVRGVARAKGEIYGGLQQNGMAVINADDANAPLWRELAAGHRVLEFGLQPDAQVMALYDLRGTGSAINVTTPRGKFFAELKVPGLHNVCNALAAIAAAEALGIDHGAMIAGLAQFSGVNGRLQLKHVLHGAVLIDDTYNANPGSVRAALDVLGTAHGKKILVLGDMGELGSDAWELHGEIGVYARQCEIDMLFALGEQSRNAVLQFGKGGRHFERIQELLAEVENLLAPGVTVLVKGSRFMQMERVVRSFE